MPSKASSAMVAAGAVVAFVGVCFFPSALGEHGDTSLLGLGAAVFGLGALIMAAGIYLKAQAAQAKGIPASFGKEGAGSEKRPARGACDLCRKETPVVHCKVHQFHLCGRCLAEHYDFRACVYVPSTRRVEGKNGKGMSAKAR